MPVVPKLKQNKWAAVFNIAAVLLSLVGVVGSFALLRYPHRVDYIQFAHIREISWVTLPSLLGAIICWGAVFRLTYEKSNPLVKAILGSGVLALCTCILMLFNSSATLVKSVYTAQNMCINRARQIGGAKAAWAEQTGATNGAVVTWNDLAPYFTNDFPRCPEGGQYELGKVGGNVICSNPKHRLPE